MTDNYIISTQYDGQKRKLYITYCIQCNNSLYRPRHIINSGKQFCNKICSSEYRARNRIECVCAQCGHSFKRAHNKTTISKSGLQFCSRVCKDTAQRIGGIEAIMPDHYGEGSGISSYRSRALHYYGAICQQCHYDKEKDMLDVHHKDGNRDNNELSNLEVLCVWCHTLETRKVKNHNWNGKLK